jgi:hypothetical protein
MKNVFALAFREREAKVTQAARLADLAACQIMYVCMQRKMALWNQE